MGVRIQTEVKNLALEHGLDLVELWSDGSAWPTNPGPGGWATVLVMPRLDYRKELHGGEEWTTNNRMELTAVIEGLSALKKRCAVIVYSDSKYVVDGLNNWMFNWRRNNWVGKSKSPVMNVDLWLNAWDLWNDHLAHASWVKGHSGIVYNERADELANGESHRYGRLLLQEDLDGRVC